MTIAGRFAWSCVLLVAVSMSDTIMVSANEPAFNEGWRWAVYTTETGLPSNDIVDLVETKNGTPWVSTRGGVAWFDGYVWHAIDEASYIPKDMTRGRAAWIESFGDTEVLVIRENTLFRGGVTGLHPVNVTFESQELLVESAVAYDDRRILLLGRLTNQPDCRLFLLNENELTAFDTPGHIPSDPLRRLWRTRAGNLWLTGDDGLFRWRDGRWQHMQYAATEYYHVASLEENLRGDGILYAIYPREVKGTWTWSRDSPLRAEEPEGNDQFYSFSMTDEGDVVGLCRSGMIKTRVAGQWSSVLPTPVYMSAATFLRYTGHNDLWVGTRDGLHLYRMNARRWQYWRHADGSPRDVVNDIVAAHDGTFWIGTGAGIEHRGPNGNILEIFEVIAGVKLAPITGLAIDENQHVWACSGSGFTGAFRWDGRTWKRYDAAQGLSAGYIHRIIPGHGGGLWFAALGNLMPAEPQCQPGAFLLRGGKFENWRNPQGYLNERIYDIAESAEGDLWFATVRGLSRYRRGEWKRWGRDEGLRHHQVFTVAIDGSGRLWFGQPVSGLGFIDENDVPQYVQFPTELRYGNILNILLDSHHKLWVTTGNGVFCHSGDVWTEFSRRCGLDNPCVWPILPLKDRVYLGTDGAGTSVLSITEEDLRPVRVAIRTPAIEESTAWITWSALAHRGSLPSRAIETRFRLDGGSWSEWNVAGTHTLRKLSHGLHRFEVQAKGFLGDLSVPESTAIYIAAPMYLRPSVVLPVVTGLFAAILMASLLLIRARSHTAAMAASQRQLQAILDNTPAVVYMKDRQHKYIMINRRYEEQFHVTRQDVVGKSDHDIFSREAADKFHANDTRIFQLGKSMIIEEIAPHDDGPHTYISAKFPMFDQSGTLHALCGISTDITPLKQAEQAMRRQALVFDNIHDGVIVTDMSGCIVDWNTGAERIFGRGKNETIGQRLDSLLHPESARESLMDIREVLHSTGRWSGEVRYQRPDGGDGWVEMVVVPLFDEHHQMIGKVLVNRDVTARRRIESEKAALEDQLRHSQKMEAVGTLASGIAHDFNNLLQAIFGFTELAKATLSTRHPAMKSLEMVEEAGQQARGVINSLLTFTHKGVTEKTPVNLTGVVRKTLKLLRRILPAAITVIEELADDELWVNADETQIQQIIMNLAINARDAMPTGGRLSISLAPVQICNGGADEVLLSVSDTGSGMTTEVLARLFEPYFTTKPRGQGTGLGMSIIHGIVVDHGGRIEVESAPGQGARVTVTLARCAPATVTLETAAAPQALLGRGEAILVVEDDAQVRSIIVSALRAQGYDVLDAVNADEAMSKWHDRDGEIRLVILDLDLPSSDRLTEWVRRFADRDTLPVVLITGGVEREPDWLSHATCILRKPFAMQQLLTRVADCFAGKSSDLKVLP